MDNYDDNIEELDEASSSSSSKLNIGSAARNIGNTTKNAARNTGRAVEETGKAVKNTGKAVEGAGKVAQKAGQLTQKAGQGIDKAGDSMLSAGKALSSSGYGAIAGVPLSILGGVTKAAGLGTQAVGKGTELAGKGTEASGKGVQKTGEGIEKTGQTVRKSTGSINGTFSLKKLKRWLIVASAVASVVILFALMVTSAVADMWPNFIVTTMTGGTTTYSKDGVPTDLTENGVDTWTEEQKKLFTDLTKDKEYYDKGFSNYGASNILENNNEQLDNSTVVATIHYQGTVNLTTFDKKYEEFEYDDGTTSSDYKGEPNVENQHTRDFYEQAGEKVGNTFIMYPGTRMLLGYLVKNNVNFSIVKYEEWYEDGVLYSNAGEVLSDWNYLGKITAESEEKAKNFYSVLGTINNIVNGVVDNRNYCNKDNDWNAINKCYDVDTIYDEIFGEKFDIEDSSDVISYLEEKYDDENALVPTGRLINGRNYITVNVSKKIDYDLYEKYLKEVYIPYVYINCDNCGYKDESEEFKEAYSENIYGEIIEFVNAFKDLNNEELIYYQIGYIGGSGTHGVSVDYNCDNGLPGYGDYLNHDGIDINGVPEGTKVYPLFGGTVIQVGYISASSTCYADCDNNTDICICKNCASGMDQMGNYVAIKGIAADGEERIAYYLHFSSIPDYIKVGEQVDEYTVIGYVGTTGCSTGNHLHIDFRDTDGLNTYKHYGSYAYKPNNIYTIDALRSTVCSRIGDNDEE